MGLPQPQPTVHAAHPVVVVDELPISRDRADIRVAVQVIPHAPDERLRGASERRVGLVYPSRRLVVGHEHAHGSPADLAGELAPVTRVDHRPRVDQGGRRRGGENLLPLEEERPLLGVEQREPLVDLDLRPVGLDLRKIGVVGEVEREIRGQAVFHAYPYLAQRVFLGEVPVGRQRAGLDAGNGRQDLEIAAGGQVGQTVQHPHLRQLAGDVERYRRPDQRL